MKNTKDFKKCLEQQREAVLNFQPDLVVGSSFGGALALILAHQKVIQVPILLLAQAYKGYYQHFALPFSLPKDLEILLVHGDQDGIWFF